MGSSVPYKQPGAVAVYWGGDGSLFRRPLQMGWFQDPAALSKEKAKVTDSLDVGKSKD